MNIAQRVRRYALLGTVKVLNKLYIGLEPDLSDMLTEYQGSLIQMFYGIMKLAQISTHAAECLDITNKEQTDFIRMQLNAIVNVVAQTEKLVELIEVESGTAEPRPMTVDDLIKPDRPFHPKAQQLTPDEFKAQIDEFHIKQ